MLDFTLPDIASLAFEDTCDADNCFTVIDSYSTPEPNGFTVWDTTCPGTRPPPSVGRQFALDFVTGFNLHGHRLRGHRRRAGRRHDVPQSNVRLGLRERRRLRLR